MKKSGAALIILALCGVYLALLMPRLLKVGQLQERSSNLDEQLIKLRQSNAQLEKELKLLQSDPVYLEKVARGKFNKAKEGEIVYKVVRNQSANRS